MEKNKVMMIVIIVLLVALLGTIVGVGYFMLTNMNKPEAEVTPAPVVEVDLTQMTTFSLGQIKRNLRQENQGEQYIQLEVSFEINSSEDVEGAFLALLTSKVDMARDAVLSVIGTWSLSEIKAENGEALLKEQILDMVKDVFDTNLIWKVNFADIIYQST